MARLWYDYCMDGVWLLTYNESYHTTKLCHEIDNPQVWYVHAIKKKSAFQTRKHSYIVLLVQYLK